MKQSAAARAAAKWPSDENLSRSRDQGSDPASPCGTLTPSSGSGALPVSLAAAQPPQACCRCRAVRLEGMAR